MKQIFIIISLALVCFSITQAQSKNDKSIAEINILRSKVVEAINRRDKKMLEEIYAEDFTHTHASGKVDNKKTRLDTFLAGEKTIDTAPAEDLKVNVFGKETAVATGKSSVRDDAGKTSVYRWTVVYAKIEKKWRIVASQATKLSE